MANARRAGRARKVVGGIVNIREIRRMTKALKVAVVKQRKKKELPRLAGYGERRRKIRTPFGTIASPYRVPGAKKAYW